MLEYHPDTNNSHDAHDLAIELNKAKDILLSADKRKQYDEDLDYWARKDAEQTQRKKEAEQAQRRREAEANQRKKEAEQAQRRREAEANQRKKEAEQAQRRREAEQASSRQETSGDNDSQEDALYGQVWKELVHQPV